MTNISVLLQQLKEIKDFYIITTTSDGTDSDVVIENAIQVIENTEYVKSNVIGLLEASAEEIENLYGRETDLTIKIRDFITAKQ